MLNHPVLLIDDINTSTLFYSNMEQSPNNNNKNNENSAVVELSSDDYQDSDDIPADPNNPYDYRHFYPGGMHEHLMKRKHSSSSEASVTPPSKKPTIPRPADVPEPLPKREAERRAAMAPPVATFRNSPLPSRRVVSENAARVIPQPVLSNARIPPNPLPTRLPIQPTARLYAASPECRNLICEMKSEKSRHAARIKYMTEIHALEEQLSQAKHTADMRRLQELIITENGYRRESARFEQEIETERHNQKMAHLSRQIAAEQKYWRERELVR